MRQPTTDTTNGIYETDHGCLVLCDYCAQSQRFGLSIFTLEERHYIACDGCNSVPRDKSIQFWSSKV